MKQEQGNFFKGVSWSFMDNLAGTGINFIVGILLANKLSPEEFALVGLTLFMVAISNVIVDGGFSNALIRKVEVEEIEYHTTFAINVSCGIVVYAVFYAIAPLLAVYYALPELKEVARIVGLIIILASLAVVPRTRLTKAMDFKSQAKASLTASITGSIIALLMVYNDYGIWSIVVQQLVRQSLYTVLLWLQIRLLPQFRFSLQSAKELFSFGSRILLSGLLDSLYNNVYYFVIGKVYTPRQLGLYTRAEQFSSTLAINFAMVLQRVSLPLFAGYKDDEQVFANTFRRQYQYSAFFGSLLAFTTWATAEHLVLTLVGYQWTDSIPILRILCFSALLQPLIVLHQNVLQAYGKSQLFFNIELSKKLSAIAIIALCIQWGMIALLWGIVFIAFASLLLNANYSQPYLKYYSLHLQMSDALRSIFPLGTWSTAVYFAGASFSSHLTALLLQILLMGIGSTVLFCVLFPTDYQKLRQRLLRHDHKE